MLTKILASYQQSTSGESDHLIGESSMLFGTGTHEIKTSSFHHDFS